MGKYVELGDRLSNKGSCIVKSPIILALALLILAFAAPCHSAEKKSKKNSDEDAKTGETDAAVLRRTPIARIGLNLGVPEAVSLDGMISLGPKFAVRLFVAPSLPVTVHVLGYTDEVQLKSRLKIGTPPTDVDVGVRYGPHFGIEGYWFPWGNQRGWFAGGGFGYRRMTATADETTNLLVCFVEESVPCDGNSIMYESSTTMNVSLDMRMTTYIARLAAGYSWEVEKDISIIAFAGLLKPFHTKRVVNVSTLIGETTEVAEFSQYVSDSMSSIQAKKEQSLQDMVDKQTKKYDEMMLPILSLTAAWKI